MDPNVVWEKMVNVISHPLPFSPSEEEHDEIIELCESMRRWINNGGFVPPKAVLAGFTSVGVIRLCTMLAHYSNSCF